MGEFIGTFEFSLAVMMIGDGMQMNDFKSLLLCSCSGRLILDFV
jgi:hypothetical protein